MVLTLVYVLINLSACGGRPSDRYRNTQNERIAAYNQTQAGIEANERINYVTTRYQMGKPTVHLLDVDGHLYIYIADASITHSYSCKHYDHE